MNTDRRVHQQHPVASMNAERDRGPLEKVVDASKSPPPPPTPFTGIEQHPVTIDGMYDPESDPTLLTPMERRERWSTLFVIALISLLTGRISTLHAM